MSQKSFNFSPKTLTTYFGFFLFPPSTFLIDGMKPNLPKINFICSANTIDAVSIWNPYSDLQPSPLQYPLTNSFCLSFGRYSTHGGSFFSLALPPTKDFKKSIINRVETAIFVELPIITSLFVFTPNTSFINFFTSL